MVDKLFRLFIEFVIVFAGTSAFGILIFSFIFLLKRPSSVIDKVGLCFFFFISLVAMGLALYQTVYQRPEKNGIPESQK